MEPSADFILEMGGSPILLKTDNFLKILPRPRFWRLIRVAKHHCHACLDFVWDRQYSSKLLLVSGAYPARTQSFLKGSETQMV